MDSNPNIDAFFDLAHHDVLALVKKKLDELTLEEQDLKTAQTNANVNANVDDNANANTNDNDNINKLKGASSADDIPKGIPRLDTTKYLNFYGIMQFALL